MIRCLAILSVMTHLLVLINIHVVLVHEDQNQLSLEHIISIKPLSKSQNSLLGVLGFQLD